MTNLDQFSRGSSDLLIKGLTGSNYGNAEMIYFSFPPSFYMRCHVTAAVTIIAWFVLLIIRLVTLH